MERMRLKYKPIKNQVFDFGRTINPVKCSECKSCDFMNCKNYAPQVKRVGYNFSEWYEFYKTIFEESKQWTYKQVNAVFDDLIVGFPKGLFWDFDIHRYKLRFVTIRNGKERVVGEIDLNNMYITDYYLSSTQEKFLNKVLNILSDIKNQ